MRKKERDLGELTELSYETRGSPKEKKEKISHFRKTGEKVASLQPSKKTHERLADMA